MRNHKNKFLIIVFLLSIKLLAFQDSIPNIGNEMYSISFLGIEDGLTNNSVTSIYKDKRGLMWIGTYDGISRYDAYKFVNYRNEPNDSTSLINNKIVSISGTLNDIWLGTKGGLCVYDYLTDKFKKKYCFNPHTGINEVVSYAVNVVKEHNGKMYVGTAGKGLMRSLNDDGILNMIPLSSNGNKIWDYHVQGIDFDDTGSLWAFIQGEGIAVLRPNSNEFKIVFSEIKSGFCLVYDEFSNIWIGLENGISKYNVINKSHVVYYNSEVKYPIMDLMYNPKKKELWIGTDGNGAIKYKYKSNTFSSLSYSANAIKLSSKSVTNLFLDTKGDRVWLGTLRGGVDIVENQKNPFTTISENESLKNTIASNFILSFCEESKDRIWIGTDGGGVSLWDRKHNKFTNYKNDPSNYQSLPNDFVTTIIKDKNGVWLGTYGGGVGLFNSKTKQFKKYTLFNPNRNFEQKNIWNLFKTNEGDLWAATSDGEGLYRFNKKTNYFDFVDAKVGGIISITQDLNGDIWVGTFSKLIKLDLKSMNHQIFDFKYPVRTIYSHSKNKMLVGTEGGGLIIFNTDTLAKKILTQATGLSNNSILNIEKDNNGFYWMSSYNGLMKFNLEKMKIIKYYDSDGLQSNQFNYNASLKLSSGEILMGGIKGFNIINPKITGLTHDFPKLIITSVKVNNKPLVQSGKTLFGIKKIKLPYDESMITVEYAGLDYRLPNKISYAYFLEGWDTKWHYVENTRTANYSKLLEGDYVLKIKSTNAEGVWNTDILEIPISILPPWYRTLYAYGVYLILLILGILVVDKYQRKQTLLKYQVDFAQNLAKKEKELNEKKITFFTNISHEFRSPLTMIINPLKDIIYGDNRNIDPGVIEVVYRNSRRLLSLVDQLLLFRKAETGTGQLKIARMELVGLCKEVFTCFTNQANTKNITYTFKSNVNEVFVYADRQKIEIALFNLISNALKFTNREKSKVHVELILNDENVLIRVLDNGIGVANREKNNIFNLFYQSNNDKKKNEKGFGIGLYLVKEFINLHHGNVICLDNKKRGSIFEIKLQLGKDHFKDVKVLEDLGDRTMFLEEILESDGQDEETRIEQSQEFNELVKDFKNVLIVDDNPQMRRYLNKILLSKYKIHSAKNAELALEMIHLSQPDIIISDVVMDGMSGVDFCKAIKSDENLKHIPVILLTGGSSEEVKLKGAEVGAEDYITKPFDKDYLLARINGILTRSQNVQSHLLNTVTENVKTPKLSAKDKELLDKIVEVIESNMEEESFNVKMLALEMGMSHSLIYKKIKKITGKSATEFTRGVRLRKVATLLITTDAKISQAANEAGFVDLKYFRKQFQQFYNMTPTEFRKKYKNVKDNQYILNESFWKPN